jgi:signal transduction histidine kinase
LFSEEIDHLLLPDDQVIIYRVMQEVFTNIEKHAHAKNISLNVERQGDLLSFSITDDGEGFDLEQVLSAGHSQRGFGLATMVERARMLGGSLTVWSDQGKGTRVTLSVPVGTVDNQCRRHTA